MPGDTFHTLMRLQCDSVLYEGATLTLTDAQRTHIRSVRRLRDGEHLRCFNAENGEWLGSLTK
ncbi:MAG: RNA methyltransferase PUA domain-containing protein, partial [Pseudomonadota bacterium]